MKKSKLLGLGVCALSLSAVAGIVSIQRAIEAKAEVTALYLHHKDSSDGEWSTSEMTLNAGVYSIEITVTNGAEFTFKAIDGGDKWCDKKYIDATTTGWPNASQVVDGNITYSGEGGTFVVTATNPHLWDSKWGVNMSIAPASEPETSSSAASSSAASSESPSSSPASSSSAAEVVYTAKLGANALSLQEVDPGHVDMAKQFKGVVTASQGAELTLYADGELIDENVDEDDGSSFIYTANGVFVLDNDVSEAELYVKIWKSGYVTVWSAQKTADVPAADGYYLCGNESFSGQGKGWKYSGAKKMSAPESGDNKAELYSVQMKVGDSVRARSYLEETDTWLSHGGEDYEFADLDGENYVFKKAGYYNFFVNSQGKLYIAGTGAGPIAEDGYVWLSTGDYGDGYDLYLYTWKGENENKVEGLGAFPGTKVSEIKQEEVVVTAVSDCLNFNSAGGIWKVPASAFLDGGKFIVTAKKGESVHQTGDLSAAADIYVNVSLGDEATADANTAKQAVVAYEIASAVNSATNKSVCAVASVTANTIVGHYDALNNDHDIVDDSTLWTYAGSEISDEEGSHDNIKLSAIVLQLRAIASQQNQTLMWNSSVDNTNNTPLIITLVAIGGAVVVGASVFFATRKKKNN